MLKPILLKSQEFTFQDNYVLDFFLIMIDLRQISDIFSVSDRFNLMTPTVYGPIVLEGYIFIRRRRRENRNIQGYTSMGKGMDAWKWCGER